MRTTSSFVALNSRNYRYFFGGQLISLCGTWMQQLAMSWLTYRLTGSPALMGLAMFFTQAPSLFLSPFAGARADRSDKRKGVILIQSAFLIQTGTLAVITLSGHATVWIILFMALLQGLITAYDFPFRQSLVPDMLDDRAHIPNAIALNSLIVNAARIIGPSLAGLIVAKFGEGWCFAFNSLSYLGCIIALLMMRIDASVFASPKISRMDSIKSGFNYVWQHRSIRAVMSMLLVASFIGTSYMTLLPILVSDILHGTAQEMGFLMAATGVGAIVSAVYLSLRQDITGLDYMIGGAVLVGGIAEAILAACGHLWIAFSIMPFIGLSLTFQMAASNTFVQTTTDNEMRGRVMGIYALIWNGISPFGNLLYGVSAQYIGVEWTIICGGIIMIASAAAYFMLYKKEKLL